MRVVSVVVLVAMIASFLGHRAKMGTKLEITSKESVNYSGSATESEAKSLGELLKTIGFFDNTSEKDVLLHKESNAVTEVSFVVKNGWDDAEIVSAFTTIGQEVAKTMGKPLVVRMLDEQLNKKKEIRID